MSSIGRRGWPGRGRLASIVVGLAGLVVTTLLQGCAGGGLRAKGPQGLEAPPRDRGDARILVLLEQTPPSIWPRQAGEIATTFGLRIEVAWNVPSLDLPCVVFALPPWRPVDRTVREIAAFPRVRLAQRVNTFHTLESDRRSAVPSGPTYDDPYVSLQHGLQNLGLTRPSGVTGRGVRVGVVDTRVDLDHPDLLGGVVKAYSSVDDPGGDGAAERHGTAVAGVIGARANNGEGIVGVAPESEIVAVRACRETAVGSECDTYTLLRAVDVALNEQVSILNLSLTGPEDAVLALTLHEALRRGVVVVAAADPTGAGGLGFPADLPGVIAAAPIELEHAERLTPHETAQAPIEAPGIDILTTVPNGSYDFVSGSSFAAAHASGMAALLLESEPSLTPKQVEERLRRWPRASVD